MCRILLYHLRALEQPGEIVGFEEKVEISREKCKIGEKGRETLDKKIIFVHTYVCVCVRAFVTMYEHVNIRGIFRWNQKNISISGCCMQQREERESCLVLTSSEIGRASCRE